jgi:bZIP transcription factor.
VIYQTRSEPYKASADKSHSSHSQRAFRERKEQHVRDLEDKVNSLEDASNTLQADNERLKRELARFTTENEILRATSQHANYGHVSANQTPEPTVTGPMKFCPTDFHATFMADGPGTPQSAHHRLTVCPITGEKLLDPGAVWDLIQKHELFQRGQLDIGDVTERLKGMSQCDGQGPAFKESQVLKAIEESAAAGRDELI